MHLTEMSNNLNHHIPDFPLNGELKRFKNEKGKYPFWAIGREWEYKGNSYKVIKYGDWRDGSVYTWKNYDIKNQSKQFVKKQRENLDEIIAQEKYETQKKNQACVEKWLPKYKAATKSITTHEYLENKQVNANYLAKTDHNDTLIIPAYDHNGFVGGQLIFKSPETQKFVKRFTSGIKLKGSICPIGKIKSAKYVYVAEGFATAATIFEATGIPTICAWNCNNLHAAIQTLRVINPKCRIIIAADKDTKKESKDIGVKKAFFCKSRFSNVIVKIPEFEHFDTQNTDFNDLLHQADLDTVKNQLAFSDADFIEITLLGHDDEKYYYFNSQSLELKKLSVDKHNENHLMSMAGHKYWGERYRFRKDKEGNPTEYADIKYCVEKLFEEQRLIGFFNFQNVRGYGAWIDNGRTVINLGDRQIVDGEFVENVENSKYLYTSNYPMPIDYENPLTDAESQKIIQVFKNLNYKNKGDYIYLTSFVALSQVFNAVDWRPQLWLTGAKGSGKTAIMKFISKLMFDSEIFQSVTSAAVRQYLKSDAMPMIIDEAEPNCNESKKRMNGLIELIRQCSSRMNTKMLRGTTHGTAQEFNINSMFCLASIQAYLPTQADISRFFVVEMMPNDKTGLKKWVETQKLFSEIENWSPRLFARMVKLIPTLNANIETLKEIMAESEFISDPRQLDQICTAMASHFALVSSNPIMDDDLPLIMEMIRELNLGHSEYEENNDVDEAENCLDSILDTLTVNRHGTIRKFVNEIKKHGELSENKEVLEDFGIRYNPENNQLFISANNRQMKKELRDTMYHDYAKILRRHPSFVKYSTCRVIGSPVKGVFIKF